MLNGVWSRGTVLKEPSGRAISRRTVWRGKFPPPLCRSTEYGSRTGGKQTSRAGRGPGLERGATGWKGRPSGLDARLLADLEATVEILQGVDDAAVLELLVPHHGRAEEALLADLDRLAGGDVAHPVPEGVVERVRRLGEPAVLHRERDARHDRRAVEEGDRRVHLHRHQRPVVAAAAEARHVVGDPEGGEHLAGRRKLALDANQHHRIVLSGVFPRDVVQARGGDNGQDLARQK